MRALEKLDWKSLRAQQKHLDSNDKMADWENEEAMRVDGDDAIGPTCFTASVTFLMKQAGCSQVRLQLFKRIRVECSIIHDGCLQAINTENPKLWRRKKLEQRMREAASIQAFTEEWVTNEARWFEYIDEYLSDVIERFTKLYTRQDPRKDDDFEVPEELENGEFVSKPIMLTRH